MVALCSQPYAAPSTHALMQCACTCAEISQPALSFTLMTALFQSTQYRLQEQDSTEMVAVGRGAL